MHAFGNLFFFCCVGFIPARPAAASPYADPCDSSASQTHEGDVAVPLSEDRGDIAVPLSEDLNSRPGAGDAVGDTGVARKRAATANRSWRWANGVIPYNVSQEYTVPERQLILAAMSHWMNNTCVRFRQRTFEVDYVNIYPGDCCASYVGRTGGMQGVSLSRIRCMAFPTIVHELGHAVGFWHEQSRPDRDSYVSIAFENVIPGTEYNFDKLGSRDVNSLGVAYDYMSIMHYSQVAWSANGQRTINAIDPAYAGSIGGAATLSPLDRYQTNLLYGCDSDECVLHVDRCDKNADCRNMVGGLNSYQCHCKPGYYGNGTTCSSAVLVDECMQGTHVCEQNCTDTNTTYLCSCGSGYQLTTKGNCTDINECWTSNGGCPQMCQNTAGSYLCLCYNGYALDVRTEACNDINECLVMNGMCSHRCNNTPGSYQCSCNPGYTLGANKRTCVDINECSINNGDCSQLCLNTMGNYSCSCRAGYYLSSNGKSCIFINACAVGNGGCAQICVVILGPIGRHVCICRKGYSRGADNTSCNDINECSTNNGGCSQACVNSVGSFSCRCGPGYYLSTNILTCTDIDECQLEPCEQICTNTVGSYQCSCDVGYRLNANGRDCYPLGT